MANGIADRVQRLDLLENTWLGVTNRIQSVFSKRSGITNKNIQVVPAIDMEDVEYLQQQKSENLELPLIGVAPIQVEPDINSYNAMVMRKDGYPIQFDSDRANWIVPKLTPIVLTFQVLFITDDVLTLMKIIDRWTSFETWGFNINHEGWLTKIQVAIDKNLQVPPRSPNSGNSRQFRLVTTLQAKTYSGYVWFIPSVRYVNLQTKIPLQGTIADAMEDPEVLGYTVNVKIIDSNPIYSPVDYEPKA